MCGRGTTRYEHLKKIFGGRETLCRVFVVKWIIPHLEGKCQNGRHFKKKLAHVQTA